MPWQDEQAAFAAALPAPHLPAPGFTSGPAQSHADRRFNIYRNNHVSSLIDVLAAGFPVVRALVGDEFFRAMTAEYIRQHPPRTPVLLAYGETFPDFIASFPPAGSLPYLPDMAKLERAMAESLNAGDADPLTINALASIDPAALADQRLILHPSARWVESDWPVISIWQAHQTSGTNPSPDARAGAERAIILRPDLTVDLHRAEPGAYKFYCDLASGSTLGDASDALGEEAAAILPGLLGTAFAMGLVTAISGQQPKPITTGNRK
tara:strand:+ start:137101 stop:137898 length:798 start_codon:yes stop_codon:yes gene_type:complete